MKGLGKRYPPDRAVLKDIWLSFLPGAKIGVLGANGAGKSTLLRIMAGEITEFDGEAFPARGISIGYLPQEPRLDPSKTVSGNVNEGVAAMRDLLRQYDRVVADLASGLVSPEMDEALEEQGILQNKIDAARAWDLDSRVMMAMDALRLPPGSADVSTLSGGERRRVALCRLLLQSPDLLLLDEPTNHLDAESVAWLERFLAEYKGTIVAVTHDRYFLDNVAGGFSSSTAAPESLGGELLLVAGAEAAATRCGSEARSPASPHPATRARVDLAVPARPPGEGQGAAERLRAPAGRGHRAEARVGRDIHSTRPAARRRRRRGDGRHQGLRGARADRGPLVYPAPRRHRRCGRPQRVRQDDAPAAHHRRGRA